MADQPTQLVSTRETRGSRSSKGSAASNTKRTRSRSPVVGDAPRKTSDGASSTGPSAHRSTRKRPASLAEEDEMDIDTGVIPGSHKRNTSAESAASADSASSASHVCLCQPDPKIPRPRNAFILYRQHHQASTVSKHPGMSNPEISKIIGEQWRSEPLEQKNYWKHLADEEKFRHQQQYPDYRYQPRRGGRDAATVEASTSAKYRCPKCGGRNIISPNGPISGKSEVPTPTAGQTPTGRYFPLQGLNTLNLNSPQARRTRVPPTTLPSPAQYAPAARDMALSPPLQSADPKRRRFNPPTYMQSQTRTYNGPATPYPMPQGPQRSPSLPHPDPRVRMRAASQAGRMPPPPLPAGFPNHAALQNVHTTNAALQSPRLIRSPQSARAMSVSLPPLSIATAGVAGDGQRKSVAAIVMDMHYLAKIQILRRIAPPLKQPAPLSPAPEVRGAVIAVEGDDPEAVRELVRWLREEFRRGGDMVPRVVDAPGTPREGSEASLQDYLRMVEAWQARSTEVIRYVTTAPKDEKEEARKQKSGSVSPTDDNEEKSTPTLPSAEVKTPVVLIPNYQYHASNAYACAIPISDSYSPGDHWQWMATLWRGVVGPDITIYVRDTPAEDMEREKLVEEKEQLKTLVVRRKKGMEIEERALRRVGFEIGEWIRALRSKAEKKRV